jgi:hypothetical protein
MRTAAVGTENLPKQARLSAIILTFLTLFQARFKYSFYHIEKRLRLSGGT